MREIKEYKDIIQGSPEWRELRCGRITASEAGDFLGTSDAFEKLLYKKAAEILTGNVEVIKATSAMERGHELEPRSRVLFEMRHPEITVNETGFFAIDDFFGVSPDGTFNSNQGWENKSINATDHLQLFETGKGCKAHGSHLNQCKFSLYFLEYRYWNLCYYHSDFPDEYCLNELSIELDDKTEKLLSEREQIAIEFLSKYKQFIQGNSSF